MRERRAGEFIGAAVFSVIIIVAMNTAPIWRPLTHGVVLPRWSDILWAANLSLAAQMVGNLLLAAYRPPWFLTLMQTVFAAGGLLSVIVFFLVFPLNFSLVVGAWLNTLVWLVLIVGIAGSAIALVVNLVRFIVAVVRMGTGSAEAAGSGGQE
ncbi:MAG: hypothetical protein ABSG63_04710 [Spirochaetia bacterium]|jgi:hypothetical protein